MIYFNDCFYNKIIISFPSINKENFIFNLYTTIIKIKTYKALSNNQNIILNNLIKRCQIYYYLFNIIKFEYYNLNNSLNFELDIFTFNSINIFKTIIKSFNNPTPYIKYESLTNNQLKDLFILLESYFFNKLNYINYNLNLLLFDNDEYFDIITDIYGNTLVNNIIFEDTEFFLNSLIVEVIFQLFLNNQPLYY